MQFHSQQFIVTRPRQKKNKQQQQKNEGEKQI